MSVLDEVFEHCRVVPATPGHWSIYRIDTGEYIKRSVIAWAFATDGLATMAMAIHPGVTGHCDTVAAVIDPHGAITSADGSRRWGSWLEFKAWIKAGGEL